MDSVAHALNTDFVSLARDDSPDRLLVNGPDDAVVVWSSALGSRAVLHVATTCEPPAEPWTRTLEPNDIYQAEADPAGPELYVVLSAGSPSASRVWTASRCQWGHRPGCPRTCATATRTASRPVRFVRGHKSPDRPVLS